MCEYVNIKEGKCNITKDICPYLYFCNKEKRYKVNSSMPSNCKIKQNAEIPNGYYKVCFQRKGNLYISVDKKIEIIKNPYDFMPTFVKMTKLKSGAWKIKEAK